MRKGIIIICSFFISVQLLAQEEELNFAQKKAFIPKVINFETSSYQVEDECFLEIAGANPNSMVYCYSTPQGGSLLKRSKVNEKGSVRLIFEKEKSPSFVLNPSKKIKGAEKGSGKVQYLDQKDFIVQNISLLKDGNKLSIHFESLVNPLKNVTYELVKKDETGNLSVVQSFEASTDIQWEIFEFECDLSPRTQYSFKISSQGEERYVKDVFNTKGQIDYVIYPKTTSDYINVEYRNIVEVSPYRIYNSKGILCLSGELTEKLNTIELNSLSSGSYFIQLDKYPNDTEVFVKN